MFWSWMVLFGSLLDELVSCFVHVVVLSIFDFDAVQLMNFSTVIDGLYAKFMDWDSYFAFTKLVLRIQDWNFMLKFMMVLCRF